MVDVCIICGYIRIISTIITIILGTRIFLTYFKYRDNNFLYVGITFIFLWTPWWPSSISFITYLISGETLPISLYLLIGYFFLPIAFFLWMIASFNLLFIKDHKRTLGLLFGIIYIAIYEIIILYYIFNPSEAGYFITPVVVTYNILLRVIIIPLIAIVLILGLMITFKSFKSDNPDVKLKGKLLFIAFITISVGVIIEIPLRMMIMDAILTILIARIITIVGVIFLYLGFLLPKGIKKRLHKS